MWSKTKHHARQARECPPFSSAVSHSRLLVARFGLGGRGEGGQPSLGSRTDKRERRSRGEDGRYEPAVLVVCGPFPSRRVLRILEPYLAVVRVDALCRALDYASTAQIQRWIRLLACKKSPRAACHAALTAERRRPTWWFCRGHALHCISVSWLCCSGFMSVASCS